MAKLIQHENLSRSGSVIALFAGRFISGVLTVVAAAGLSWLWTIQEYGTYRELWLIFLTLTPFLNLGIPASVTYFIPQFDKSQQKTLLTQTVLLLMACGVFAGLIPCLFSTLLSSWFHNKDLQDLFLRFALYPIFSMPLLAVDTWLTSLRRPKDAALFNLWTALIHISTTVVPVFLGYSLEFVLFALTVGVFVRFLSFAYLYYCEYKDTTFSWDWSLVLTQMKYALPIGASAIVSGFILLLDRLIIASWYDTETFAIYYNGAKELPVVGMITGSVVSIIAPEFVRLYKNNEFAETVRVWKSSIQKVAFILFPITAFLLFFAKEFITLLFSEKYIASTFIFQIYLLLLPLRITSYGAVLKAANETRIIVVSACLALFLNLILSLLFVTYIGMIGAAIGTVVSVYATNILQLTRAAKVLKTDMLNVFPWRSLCILGGRAIFAAVVASFLTWNMRSGVTHFIFGFLIFSLSYLFLNLIYAKSRKEMYSMIDAGMKFIT